MRSSIPGAFLIAWAAKRRGGMRDPAAVPLALLVLVVLQFVSLPVLNAIAQKHGGRSGLGRARDDHLGTGRDEPLARLRRGGDGRPEPATWSYLLFDTHPSMAKRVAMAEAWRARNAP